MLYLTCKLIKGHFPTRGRRETKVMLKLEVGRLGLQKAVVDFAIAHVIRNGKRWGRYQMNYCKDIKRLAVLCRRSGKEWDLLLEESKYGKDITPQEVNGWIGQKREDLIARYGNDLLEVIAIMEYYQLWQYSSEIKQLAGK